MTEERRTTEELIGTLAGGLEPVRPLRPPFARAAGWLLLVLLIMLVPLLWRANFARFGARLAEPRMLAEWLATLATGVLAVLASFALSIPGRSERWIWLPLPALFLWLGCSGLGCLHNGVGHLDIGCLLFIVATGLPLSLLLFVWLRRARPIAPFPVAFTGALGVAALCATLLQFFHPFEVTVLDLAVHLVAVGLLLLFGVSIGGRRLAAAH